VNAKGLVRLRSPASLENIVELLAKEHRNNRRRRLVGAETVIVGRGRDDGAQQPAPSMDRSDHRCAKNQELRVGVRVVARIEKVALSRIAE
jgi:hypothetical protein